jgi:cyclopropane-fatty-acyl-phospholipid synthase
MNRTFLNTSDLPAISARFPSFAKIPKITGILDSLARNFIFRSLKDLHSGLLTIRDASGNTATFGEAASDNKLSLLIKNPRFFSRLASGGSLALGESYADGWWDMEKGRLVDLFSLLFVNGLDRRVRGSFTEKIRSFLHACMTNPKDLTAAKLNIQAHYDLGNDFYRLMLDDSMTYSCGYQRNAGDSLAKMQEQKYRRICQKLGLENGGQLIDVGCGWGGMLSYAGRHYPNISGIGITLSKEQQQYANARLQEEGLSDRIRVELCDYRHVQGSYDYFVSIGMFEHVGLDSYPTFFSTAQRLLKKDGVGLLHTIGMEEEPHTLQDPWVEKYIFPGSRLPRLEEITHEARRAGLIIGHIENWRPHYATTLSLWRGNFVKNWPICMELDPKFDMRFFRIWNYYLQLCEACFIDSTVELYQTLFCRRENWGFPLNFRFD